MDRTGGVHVGIDAVNIRLGGGITHLSQLLHAADPAASGIARITVWTGAAVAAVLPDLPWLAKRVTSGDAQGVWSRLAAQHFRVPREARAAGCQVLFCPGGTLPWGAAAQALPVITMSQNMLPFDPAEARLFGPLSWMRFKMRLLRTLQGRSFRRAAGVIFLTEYARRAILRALNKGEGDGKESAIRRHVLIPHGIEPRFFSRPRSPRPLAACSAAEPLRLLYVSIVMPYKRQCEVARAVAELRKAGLALEITFVGAAWGSYGTAFRALLDELDPQREFLKWPGAEPFAAVHRRYLEAEIFVFASGCENLPNIMIEAMAAGLPIASSDRGPMPEALGDAGVYFDPDRPASIAAALRRLIDDAALRQVLAEQAWQRAHTYSWQRCARDTLDFIASVAAGERGG